ncbi:hypothetical protein MASR1M32_31890 [Rhodobacter sp.]
MALPVAAEIKFFVDGEEVAFNTDEATEAMLSSSQHDIARICEGYLKASKALPALAAHENFPLANNKPPATDFVSGVQEMLHWGRGVGYGPLEFQMIWSNIVEDKDGAFSREERDNVVALWEHSMSWNPVICQSELTQ